MQITWSHCRSSVVACPALPIMVKTNSRMCILLKWMKIWSKKIRSVNGTIFLGGGVGWQGGSTGGPAASPVISRGSLDPSLMVESGCCGAPHAGELLSVKRSPTANTRQLLSGEEEEAKDGWRGCEGGDGGYRGEARPLHGLPGGADGGGWS